MRRTAALLLLTALAAGCASTPADLGAAGIDVQFEGSDQVPGSDLTVVARRELTSFARNDRSPADLADAAYAMERELQQRGFSRARVSFRMEPDEEHVERVVFEVREGPRGYLGEVTFPGATAFEPERLREFFRFRGTGLLFLGRPLFVRSEVDAAVSRVEQLFLVAGYLRAEVGPAERVWNEERTLADVVVPVREGARYEVGSVSITGDVTDTQRAELAALVEFTGVAYYARLTAEAGNRVLRHLQDAGHLQAEVDASVRVDHEAARAHIELVVTPGPVLTLADIEVTGGDRTRSSFVEQLVPLAEGDVLTQKALDAATNALYRTGVFKGVRMRPRRHGGDGDTRPADLLVALEELDARSVELMGGYGSYEGPRIGVRYRDRHLAGTGRLLDIGTTLSTKTAGVTVRGEDPYILGRQNVLEVSTGFQQREEPSYDARTAEGEVAVRHQFGGGKTFRGGYQLKAEDADEIDGRVRGAEENGYVRTAGLFARFTNDRRNDSLFPTDGFIARVGVGYSAPGLGADLDFFGCDLSATHFTPLGDNTVLAVGGRFRSREVLDDRRTLPIQERLFAGGEASVRSFGEDELGPMNRSDDPRGGLTSAEAHVELRQRLIADFDAALFYDVGTVSPKSFDLSKGTGYGVGIGLRYRLPIGPVRLDFAYNPGKRFAADRPWQLHLSFGFSF